MGIKVQFNGSTSKVDIGLKAQKTSSDVDSSGAVFLKGEDGATFIPEVSEEGVLSWTNDKSLENPEPVSIKGPVGPAGAQGQKGETGPQGIQGPKGDKGDKGDRGERGIQGEKGDKGDTGPKGDKGDKGDQGIQGIRGEKGETGATGATGATGPQGEQGPKGDRGDPGAVRFIVVTELPYPGEEGAIYLLYSFQTPLNQYDEYIFHNDSWEKIGVANVSVNLDDYVKKTDYAGYGLPGVVRVSNFISGLQTDDNGNLTLAPANEYNINDREDLPRAITPKNMDYAVKKVLSDCKVEWTDEEKTSARSLIGANGGATSWNDLTDKPFYELLITGDVVAAANNVAVTGGLNGQVNIAISSDFQFITGEKYRIDIGNGYGYCIATAISEFSLGDFISYGLSVSVCQAIMGLLTINFTNMLFITMCDVSVSFAAKTEIFPLDEKFIPDTIARKTDIPEPGVTSWNDLTDKPFGEKIIPPQSFVSPMDMNFTNGSTNPVDASLTLAIFNAGDFIEGKTYVVSIDGEEYECMAVLVSLPSTLGIVQTKELYSVGEHGVSVKYVANIMNYHVLAPVVDGKHSVAIYELGEAIKTIDEKYLPESVVLESELTEKGYQTEEQVTELINNALGVIENGSY